MTKRELRIVALAAVATGLAFAAGRFVSGHGRRNGAEGEVLARARGVSVRASELSRFAAPGGSAKVEVEDAIRTRVLARRAEAEGYDRDPAFVRRHEEDLAALYLEKAFEDPERKRQPTDAEVRAYYDAHRAELQRPERVRLAVIAFRPGTPGDREKKRAAAEAALRDVRARSKDAYGFGEVARMRSDDPEARTSSGELPFLSREDLAARFGAPVADAAFALPSDGALAPGVVETEQGFFVVKRLGREPARDPSFEEVREPMRAEFARARHDERRKEFLDRIWQDAGIRVDDAAVEKWERERRQASR